MKHRREYGFSLLEMVIAVIIMGIALTPLLNFFAESATRAVSAEMLGVAHFLAIDKAEEILCDRHSPTRGLSYITSGYADDEPRPGYNRTVAVQEVSSQDLETPTAGSGFYRCVVTVTCSGGDTEVSFVVCETGS